jgi:ABC-type microcin C transport system permease subunit YejE
MASTKSTLGGMEFICVDCPFHTDSIGEIVQHGKDNPEHTLDFVYEKRDAELLLDALKFFGFIKTL